MPDRWHTRAEDIVLLAAIGIDAEGMKHLLGLIRR